LIKTRSIKLGEVTYENLRRGHLIKRGNGVW